MGKDKVSDRKLVEIIYRSIFNIIEDETGNASYRKYFDKVLRDIFDMDGVITTLLMSSNQFKYIKKLMNDSDYKQFCQMLLRDDDIKAVHDLVRVAYDAAQIANKPKKSISSRDIKAYRYLTKLYTQGIKALRKKYKCNTDSKKAYKTKYANLDAMLGNSHKSNLMYDLGTLDDDESFGDLFEDDEDEEEDSQFDPMNGFDLDDLPSRFVINKNAEWAPPRKSPMILDSDDPNLALYEDFEDSEEEDSDDKEIMPQGQFQRYAMSIFERLLNKMENESNPHEEDHLHDNIVETFLSNSTKKKYDTPVEIPESQIIPDSSGEDVNESADENSTNPITSKSRILIDSEDEEQPDCLLCADSGLIANSEGNVIQCPCKDKPIDENNITSTTSENSSLDKEKSFDQETTESQASEVQKKSYDKMTREECINEFNDISSKAANADDPVYNY